MKVLRFTWRWLPLLLWMALIFALSASSNPYALIPPSVAREWQAAATSLGVPQGMDNELLGRISHASVYIVLAILCNRAVRPSSPTANRKEIRHAYREAIRHAYGEAIRHAYGLSFVLSVAYALSDETHQLFVPGRAFELLDLALDTLGVILGLSLVLLFSRPNTSPRRVRSRDEERPVRSERDPLEERRS